MSRCVSHRLLHDYVVGGSLAKGLLSPSNTLKTARLGLCGVCNR